MFNNLNKKESARILSIFLGIILFFLGVLIGLNFLSSKKWTNGLHEAVQNQLDEKNPGKWFISKNLKINSTFATSSHAFEAINKETGERTNVIIIKLPTLYGSFPAVFTSSKSKGTEFICFMAVNGRIKTLLEEDKNSLVINFWQKRIPKILENTSEGR